MALSFANTEIVTRGTFTILYTECTFDTSYATGGEAFGAAELRALGLQGANFIIPGSSEGFAVECIKSTPTSWLFQMFSISGSTNTALEAASGLDRSGVTVDLLVIGR